MGKIGKTISRLLTFAAFGAWFTFTIWGLKTWGTADSFVSEKTTVILLSLLTFVAFFILFVIAMALGAIDPRKRKKGEKKFEFTSKDGEKFEFKGGDNLDWIPTPFKEIGEKIMQEVKKEQEKKK